MRRAAGMRKVVLSEAIEAVVQDAIREKELPPRVHDILRAAMLGWTTPRMAAALGLADDTAKAYRSVVARRFGAPRIHHVARELLSRIVG